MVEAKLVQVELDSAGPRLPRDVAVLEKQRPSLDAPLPGAEGNPRVETYVGVWKPKAGLRFADVLVIEQQPPPGGPPRVETFSFKSRDLSLLEKKAVTAQVISDASEAMEYYGETLDIRRSSLKPFLREASEVPVQRVRLIYEGGKLEPEKVDVMRRAANEARKKVKGVEVLFQ